ncbi:uncharacterized protein LOC142612028 [Castanea sativa]|uniref:uncharacterized protein LOC142612028 n=1 Tax=Castanea sativa TaxID=21020 RepID=UPI003F64AB69
MSWGVNLNGRQGIFSVVSSSEVKASDRPDKRPRRTPIMITFGETDLEGMSQSHNDALVVTSRIGGSLVKRVMLDQESGAEIMYLNLYKGLELKSEDLSKYDTPLMGFDGKIVTLDGQIKLSVVTKGKEVEVNFIVVNGFSPYTAILWRPWIHAMEAIPSTLNKLNVDLKVVPKKQRSRRFTKPHVEVVREDVENLK